MCTHACVPQHKYGGQSALSRFSPTRGFQGSSAGCLSWQQASLSCFSAQHFLFSCLYCFKLDLTIYLKLSSNVAIPLPQPPECWDYRSTLQYLVLFFFKKNFKNSSSSWIMGSILLRLKDLFGEVWSKLSHNWSVFFLSGGISEVPEDDLSSRLLWLIVIAASLDCLRYRNCPVCSSDVLCLT